MASFPLASPARVATLKLVTWLQRALLRRLRLFVACLMLVLASVPPCTVLARDTSAVTVGASAARTSSRRLEIASPVRRGPVTRGKATFEPRTPSSTGLETAAPEPDRRYLYLELVTLLS